MSSTSAPFGFRASFHNSGQMRPKAYTVASTYAANIFSGDPVKMTDNGVIQLGTSDGTRSGTTDGIALLGIFVGCQYNDASGKPTTPLVGRQLNSSMDLTAHLDVRASSAGGAVLRSAAKPATSIGGGNALRASTSVPTSSNGARDSTQVS